MSILKFSVSSYISADLRQQINIFQQKEELRGTRRSDSWIVANSLLNLKSNPDIDLPSINCVGDSQIAGYIDESVKAWLQDLSIQLDRSESWVTGKAIAIFLEDPSGLSTFDKPPR